MLISPLLEVIILISIVNHFYTLVSFFSDVCRDQRPKNEGVTYGFSFGLLF